MTVAEAIQRLRKMPLKAKLILEVEDVGPFRETEIHEVDAVERCDDKVILRHINTPP